MGGVISVFSLFLKLTKIRNMKTVGKYIKSEMKGLPYLPVSSLL
jgi:hypothetical protein